MSGNEATSRDRAHVGEADPIDNPIVGPRRRVTFAFAAIAAGYLLARSFVDVPSWAWFAAACPLLVVGAFSKNRLSRASLLLAVIALGAGWFAWRIGERPRDSLATVIERLERESPAPASADRGVPLTIDGLVVEDPRRADPPSGVLGRFRVHRPGYRFIVDARGQVGADGVVSRASGRLWATVHGDATPACRAGDSIRITGLARGLDAPLNPGELDLRLFAAERGFAGSIRASDATLVLVRDDADGSLADRAFAALWRTRAILLARAHTVLDRAIPEPPRAAPGSDARNFDSRPADLVRGLVLGERGPDERSLFNTWARLGLAHVLSISGFHLAVLAGLSLFLLRLTGDRGWVEPAVVGLVVLVYALTLPAQSPILRSAAMVIGLLIAEASGRRYDRLTVLGWIAIALLVWRPLDLWSLGYQLSVGLTALLFWLGGSLRDAIFGEAVRSDIPMSPGLRHRLAWWMQGGVSSGIACGLVSGPLVLFRTGMFTPIGLLATMLVSPLVVIVLYVGYTMLISGMIVPEIAGWCGGVLGTLSRWTVLAADRMAEIPGGSIRLPTVSLWWTIAATAVMLWLVRFAAWRRARWWIALVVVLGGLGAEWAADSPRANVVLRIDSLSVGDGSCHIVRSGRDAILWDCGSLSTGPSDLELLRAMREVGIWRIPTAFITHPDIDHFGALPELIEPLGIRRVVVGERFIEQAAHEPEGTAATLLNFVKDRGVEVVAARAGDSFAIEDAMMNLVSPPPGAPWPKDNDQSLMAVVRVPAANGTRTLMLTGDVQAQAIGALRESYPDLAADILEVPHHGSAIPESIEWAYSLAPVVVMQSTGPGRALDARWSPVRDRCAWYTTCLDGAAWAEVLKDGKIRSGSVRYGGARAK